MDLSEKAFFPECVPEGYTYDSFIQTDFSVIGLSLLLIIPILVLAAFYTRRQDH